MSPTGRMDLSKRLNFAVGLPLRNKEALANLLQQIYDPASPNYRHYLTPEQFTEMFGPTEADYQTVIHFADTNGLTVTATHPNRLIVDVEGAVVDIENAFHLTMRLYQHPTETRMFHAPDAEPSLNATVPVLYISGLDDYSLPHPNLKLKKPQQMANAIPNAGSGPGGNYLGNDFRAAYVPGTVLTGAGQSVGLLQFDGYYASDITSYESQAGLPNVTLVNVPIDGGVTVPGSGNIEVALDIEMVISMAPGVSKIFVYEAPNPSPWVDLLSRMANDNLAKQLSCSWGGGPPDQNAEQIFQQMAAQGQSFFNASGDSDAFTGSVAFPADSPNITQVGGTILTTTGPGGTYVSESVWNRGNGTGSSGGISTFYGIPNYQQGINMSANQGSTTMRNIPDVALTGESVYLVYNNGSSGAVGGTSCAAPLWAGFMALVNQQAAISGKPPAGFINPVVYATGKTNPSYTSIFHDITTGNNTSASSPTQFYAAAGYDLCTGWGTPNGTNLINLLAPPVFVPVVQNAGLTLATEACPPGNGAIDPGELVTVNLALKNVGLVNTTNLVVTLQATNGVSSPSLPQTYGTVVAGAGAITRSFSFTASGACGGTITPVFQLQNAATNLGVISQSFQLGLLSLLTVPATNATSINIPAAGTIGAASVFPSTISVSGISNNVSKVTVTLQGLSHARPNDLDILLVGPAGQRILLMSDAGSSTGINNVTLTFADDAASSLPSASPIASGIFKPTNLGSTVDTFSAPAPAAPYSSTLSVFTAQNPNGTWSLYIQDDRSSNIGSLAQGWTLSITTSNVSCCSGVPPVANLAIGQSVQPTLLNVGSDLNFTLSVTNFGPDPAGSVIVIDTLPAGIAFVSGTSTQGTISNNAGVVACSLGTMTNNASATITIAAIATTAGTLTNVASAGSVTSDPVSSNNTVAATISVNAFPAMSIITNQTTSEDLTVSNITFTVGDAETAAAALTVTGASSNTNLIPIANVVLGGSGPDRTVTLIPATNAFGVANITLTVSDGQASASRSFSLTVNAVNHPPVLAAIADQTIHAGSSLLVHASATDSDVPTNRLTFSLDPSAPLGAGIDVTNGVVSWLTTDADASTTNTLTVRVMDDGIPPLSDTRTFSVNVVARPMIESISVSNAVVTVIWSAIAGQSYRLQFKDALDDPNWTDVSGEVVAVGADASKEVTFDSAHRFYRVVVVP